MKNLITLLALIVASLTFAQPRAPAPPVARTAPVAPVAPLPPLPPMSSRIDFFGPPGIPPGVAKRLGIAPEVVKKVRDLSFDANEQLIALEADLKRAQLDMERALAATPPDEASVLAKLEVVNRAELGVRKNRVSLMLRIRAAVGQPTWEKMQGELMDEGAMLSGSGGTRREVRIIRRGNANGELETEEIQGP